VWSWRRLLIFGWLLGLRCFADPDTQWQRGLNEITNGLLRQCFPKDSADFSVVLQGELGGAAGLLNNRPKMTLGWDCPAPCLGTDTLSTKSHQYIQDIEP